MIPAATDRALLIKGGRVYDHDEDVDRPAVADVQVADLVKQLRLDIDAVVARNAKMMPRLTEAHCHTWATDIGLNHYVRDGQD